MRLFEIATPDGRRVRHTAADPAAAASRLLPGYYVASEVVGAVWNTATDTMDGGWVIPIGAGESPLAALLKMHRADMLAWLEAEGFVATKAK